MKKTKQLVPREILFPFILITSLFFAWGLANNMTDTLLAAFKRILSMSDFQTSWVQMAFYGAYFCLALPAAIIIKKYSYKTGVMIGLMIFIIGSLMFYPSSLTMSYGHFLISLYVLAGGLSILETSANPYIIAMGPQETATQRINLAQSFNPIGSITGVLLSKFFILSGLHSASSAERAMMSEEQLSAIQSDELSALIGPYIGVAIVLIAILVLLFFSKMPKGADTSGEVDLVSTAKRLWKNRKYRYGVIAQFFYVGAQIGVWSYTIRYVMQAIGTNEEQSSTYYIIALVLFSGARFIFTALMKFIKPNVLLSLSAAGAIVCCLIAMFAGGSVGVWGLVFVSFFMSLMFPTIYGLTVVGLGDDTKLGGSGLIMAILGGAVLTVVQGQVSDLSGNVAYSFAIPLMCFIVVAMYGRYIGKHSKQNLA